MTPVTFGKSSGPPASTKQVAYLLALVRQAGHADFRDGRGPLGLTQRQAGGKFTGPEASALIDRLLAEQRGEPDADDSSGSTATDEPPSVVATAAEQLDTKRRQLLTDAPAELLADELIRRGWTVTPPAVEGPRGFLEKRPPRFEGR